VKIIRIHPLTTQAHAFLPLAAAAVIFLIFLGGCQAGSGNTRVIQVRENADTDEARRLNEKALKLLDADRPDDAEPWLDKAIAADEGFGLAYNNLGYVYYLRQDYYRAAWAFEKAIATMPSAGPPLNNLGLVMEEVGRFNDAIVYYEKAWGINPTNFDYASNLARAKFLRGDQDELFHKLVKRIAVQGPTEQWRTWASDRFNELAIGKD